jgi:hypothetical protein
MKRTWVAAVMVAAGSAARAQTTIEVRFVTDTHPDSPAVAGLVTPIVPSQPAPAVGLTLQARVRTATSANFGITGLANTNSTTLNRIWHDDPLGVGTLETLQRGATTAGTQVGVDLFGAFNPLRQFIGSSLASNNANNWNAPIGNAVAGQNRFPGATSSAFGTGVNATLPGTRTANGFHSLDATGRAQLQAIFLSVNTAINNVVDPNTGENTPGPGAPTAVPPGEWSQWQNLYRVVYVPQNLPGDPDREVTVSFSGVINFASAFAFGETAGSWLLTSTAGWTGSTSITLLAGPGCIPRISLQPQPQTVAIGETIALDTLTTTPGAVSIRWRKDGFPLSDDGRITGAGSRSLRISNAIFDDFGTYDAVLSTACGESYTTPVLARVRCAADIVGIGGLPPADGLVTGDDFNIFIANFAIRGALADVASIGGEANPDGLSTGDDFVAYINSFVSRCR